MQVTLTNAQHFIEAFSWMLLHSLWEGLLLALISGALLYFSRKSPAALRYQLVLSQLVFFIAACSLTFAWEWLKSPQTIAGAAFGPENEVVSQTFGLTCIRYFSANAPLVVLLWFMCFIYRSMRLMGGLLYLNRARYRDVYQPPLIWTQKINILCRQIKLSKTVRLLESGYVKVPVVIGHLKPIVLIPAGLLAGLPAAQLEAVLLHELAHIRRNDYLVNCLQTLTETVFFFNPGLLWISSILREERENCCDDIALDQTRDKKAFVQALVSFKEFTLNNYAVAFPGNRNNLLNRASRILYNKNKSFEKSEKAFFLTGLLLLIGIVAVATTARTTILPAPVKKISISIIHPKTIAAVPKAAKKIVIRPHRYHFRPVKPHPPVKTAIPPVIAAIKPIIQKVRPIKPVSANPESLQAEKDQRRAMIDQRQALIDQQQALRDQAQALRDQAQAEKDQEQAKLARVQAQKDLEQAERDRQVLQQHSP